MGRIDRHVLPSLLVELIDAGRWRAPDDEDLLRAVFTDEPDGPRFYSLADMIRQNEFFHQMSPDDALNAAGIGIDPNHAVLIGHLGADMPIALDYRASATSPRVLYLAEPGWIEVAEDFETLVAKLKI
ncbi:hypothetical protein [Kibdelosporangium aridum]|uniref:hypothetical protein n=1 Tax=Kibdelosporangium aridum TaxID=2030 RepID=UPI000A50541E|nr:hypothetical protein [Kibdelosporangium aridum]